MRIIKINPDRPERELLQEAADLILSGKVIGYPTETVYGLGTNALDNQGIEKIFELKGRDRHRPILIIAGDLAQVKRLVTLFPALANRLAQKFWPGPLTMVLEASPFIPRALLGSGKGIGIRIPDNNICLELLRLCGVPITSTSANFSGGKNPISAEEVWENFDNKLDLIIDGGKSLSRIPSTVLAIENSDVALIREGAIRKWEIEQIIGKLTDERRE